MPVKTRSKSKLLLSPSLSSEKLEQPATEELEQPATNPRRARNSIYTPSTVPRRKQQTLTQIDFVSRCSAYKKVGREYEHENTPRSRKRRKVTIQKGSRGSADKTLTQINFVKRLSSDMEDEDLAYIKPEPQESVEMIRKSPTLVGKFRDKPNTAKKSQRSNRPSANSLFSENSPSNATRTRTYLPQTPQRKVKREILSSQSPESLQLGRSYSHQKERLPLQELSTNLFPNSKVDKSLVSDKSMLSLQKPKPNDYLSPGQINSVTSKPYKGVKFEIPDSDEEVDSDGNESWADVPTTGQALETEAGENTTTHTSDSSDAQSDARQTQLSNLCPTPDTVISKLRVDLANADQKAADRHRASRKVVQQNMHFKQASAQLPDHISHYPECNSSSMTTVSVSCSQLNSCSLPPPNPKSCGSLEAAQLMVPTSQATTIDVVQSSPKTVHSPRKAILEVMSSPPKIIRESNPASQSDSPQIVIPSSPTLNLQGLGEIAAWDHPRLTDSQLLPDSIMNFELPPISSIGSEIYEYEE